MLQGYDQGHSHVLDGDAQLHYEGDTFRITDIFHNLWGDTQDYFQGKPMQNYTAAKR